MQKYLNSILLKFRTEFITKTETRRKKIEKTKKPNHNPPLREFTTKLLQSPESRLLAAMAKQQRRFYCTVTLANLEPLWFILKHAYIHSERT